MKLPEAPMTAIAIGVLAALAMSAAAPAMAQEPAC